QDLAFIAMHDVIVSAGTIDTTHSGGGNAGSLFIAAGANIIAPASGSGLPDASNTTVTIQDTNANPDRGSVQGGAIVLTGVTAININGTGTNGNGGNVTMIAYGNGTGTGTPGTITIPISTTIKTGGTGTGTNGNVLMIAGGGSGTSITTGAITTAGG